MSRVSVAVFDSTFIDQNNVNNLGELVRNEPGVTVPYGPGAQDSQAIIGRDLWISIFAAPVNYSRTDGERREFLHSIGTGKFT
jgi:hypothetical protein